MLTLDNMSRNNVNLVPYNSNSHHSLMKEFIIRHPQIWDQGFGSAYKPESPLEIINFLNTWHSEVEQIFAIYFNNIFVGCSGIIESEITDSQIITTLGRTLINPDYWGQKINYITKDIIIDKVFNTDTQKIRVSIDVNNSRSINSIQKIGFKFLEERPSRTLGKDGKPYAIYVYELNKEAWNHDNLAAKTLIAC